MIREARRIQLQKKIRRSNRLKRGRQIYSGDEKKVNGKTKSCAPDCRGRDSTHADERRAGGGEGREAGLATWKMKQCTRRAAAPGWDAG